jgi:hypothetical protein
MSKCQKSIETGVNKSKISRDVWQIVSKSNINGLKKASR